MNGGQDGGPEHPAPGGGQWPNEGPAQGGTPYGGPAQSPGPYGGPAPDPYGGQPGYGNPQPGPYGGPNGPVGPGGPDTQAMWGYGPGAVPPKKSNKGLVTGIVIAGAVVVLGGAAVAVGVASSGDDKPVAATSGAPTSPVDAGVPHSIVVPKSVGDYRLLNGSVADRLASTMRKSMGDSAEGYAEVYAKAKIAIYTKNGDTARPLIFVGLVGSDSPQFAAELKANSPSKEVDSTFLGMGIDNAEDYPAGPLGGALRCGAGSVGAGEATACAWADSSTVGMLIETGGSGAPALAKTTLDLRNAAEH
ncbi:hypothetical protein FB559_5259 [Actinoallomurus bryophytorum]|uniref:Uncharacterized protein n=1 Tax=Actinoallomurus bryophytorum TaxID=1490222 RepID=A0A543CRL7_9ACTN|nr:hypothetical protein [Actinoallomurus bryophytorum]TQL99567.1 hypothetical protein FB559_5259 [Actinoallomurus bryophytorum]